MIIHTVRVNYKYGDSFRIKPLFDTHIGNSYCDIQEIKDYLSDTDDKTFIIGGGDTFDSVIVTDKRYAKSADATKGNEIVDEQIEIGLGLLTPYSERVVGIGMGNHEYTIVEKCATNPTKRLAKALGVPHFGYTWIVRFLFSEEGSRGRKLVVKGHHGWGGGSRTQGADLTKYSKDAACWDADIFLYGHVHKRQSDSMPRLGLVGEKLIAKPKQIFICGTFLKTLSDSDESTYSERAGYPPVALGGVNITVTPTREWLKIENDV